MKPARILAAVVLFCAGHATAQLGGLPQLPVQVPSIPSLPSLPDVTRIPAGVTQQLQSALDPRNLLDRRGQAKRDLLRSHRNLIETDPAGELMVRREVVALSPSHSALDAARAAGFALARERMLHGIAERIVVLRAPAGLATSGALQRLRALDPQGHYDFNHIYLGSGDVHSASAGAHRPAMQPAPAELRVRVGLIDGGIDLRHPALRDADIRTSGCAAGTVPSKHGTAVASLLVGRARGFAGAAPGVALHAADVYCDQPTGGAAAALIEALAWMASEQVQVINISLVGPRNQMLERALRALTTRGHIIVAAVGNDGPAAPPLYPAAYDNVIGVTAVDLEQRVLPEAVRGRQVAFAAPGADMAVAESGSRSFSRARGTSFASPIVAGLLALAWSDAALAPDPAAAQRAIDTLVRGAIDLGAPGRDVTYGFGLVGTRLRVDPVVLR